MKKFLTSILLFCSLTAMAQQERVIVTTSPLARQLLTNTTAASWLQILGVGQISNLPTMGPAQIIVGNASGNPTAFNVTGVLSLDTNGVWTLLTNGVIPGNFIKGTVGADGRITSASATLSFTDIPSLPGSIIGSGTVLAARLPANVAFQDGINTFTGVDNFTGTLLVNGTNINTLFGTGGGGGGGGSVTSVAASGPSALFSSWLNSPITTTGTLTPVLNTQTSNTFFRGPLSGGAGVPFFGPLVNADFGPGLLSAASNIWTGMQYFNGGASFLASNLNVNGTAFVNNLAVSNRMPDTNLSLNVALLNTGQTFTGTNNFSSSANVFSGTFNGTLSVTNGTSFPGGIVQFGSVASMQPTPASGPVAWFLAGNPSFQNKAQSNADFSTLCISMNPFSSGSAWSVIPTTTNTAYAASGPLSTNTDGQVIYEAFDTIGTSFLVTPPDCVIPGDLPGVAQIVRNAHAEGGTPDANGAFGSRFAITTSTIVEGIPGNYSFLMTDPVGSMAHYPIWHGGKWTFDNTNASAIALDGMTFDYVHAALSVASNVNVGNILTVSNRMAILPGPTTNSDTNDYFANHDEDFALGIGTGFKVFQSQSSIGITGFGSSSTWNYTIAPSTIGWFPFTSMTIGGSELKSLTNSSKAMLEVHGSIATAYKNTATNYTAAFNDDLILVSASGVTVTLPATTGNFSAGDAFAGRQYTVKLIVAGSATVATTAGATIDGSSTFSLGSQNKCVKVQTDHTNWWVIASN